MRGVFLTLSGQRRCRTSLLAPLPEQGSLQPLLRTSAFGCGVRKSPPKQAPWLPSCPRAVALAASSAPSPSSPRDEEGADVAQHPAAPAQERGRLVAAPRAERGARAALPARPPGFKASRHPRLAEPAPKLLQAGPAAARFAGTGVPSLRDPGELLGARGRVTRGEDSCPQERLGGVTCRHWNTLAAGRRPCLGASSKETPRFSL